MLRFGNRSKNCRLELLLTNRQLAVSYKKAFAELCAPPSAQSQPSGLRGISLQAGVEGIEPSLADLESAGLPLTDTPIYVVLYIKMDIIPEFN